MKKITQWYQSFLKTIQLQLFISFISLPFLIGWGLPISILTPISTLLFGPFLTCFLLISSLIFFLELFYLPNTLLIWCLEIITSTWLACLNMQQRSWLIGFTTPPLYILLLIPCIALAVVHSKKITTINQRIAFLAILLISTCGVLKLFPYAYKNIETLACNKGEIILINHKNTLIMIDPGFLASKPSYESYIAYTLLPAIVQKTGRMSIDHLIVFKFNKRLLDALQFLGTKIIIKNLYLPAWQGKIPSFAWYSYAELKKLVLNGNGNIISVSRKKQITIDSNSTISIAPVVKKTAYYDATYQQLSVSTIIDDSQVDLCSIQDLGINIINKSI